MLPYSVWKLAHIIGVVMFLGNIVTGLFWVRFARASGDPRLISHAVRGVIRSDRLFTVPGVIVVTIFGFGAAALGGYPIWGTGWIRWSIILFSISGVAFMWKLAPLQRKMANYFDSHPEADLSGFDALMRQWELWGLIATVTPIVAFVLMVLKVPA